MKRKHYERQLKILQTELCHLQAWAKQTQSRIVVVFEGRDAAGKGGVLKCISERVSSRVFRVVALPAPTDREKTQYFMQRYISQLPAAGEIVLFDRSWYNRAGVEHVMNFCSQDEYERFLRGVPMFEKELVNDGIILLKYFLDVSQEEQEKRMLSRATDPRKHWKLGEMDIASWARYWEYTKAYDVMIRETDTDYAPWYRVNSDDKESARLSCISHLLSKIPYHEIPYRLPELPERRKRAADTPEKLTFRHEVPEHS